MKYRYRHILILAGLFGSAFTWADTSEFYETDDSISFRLEAPLSALKKQRGEDTDWLEGKVFYTNAKGKESVLNVKIEARGNFRRKRSTCQFPPYWINFKKSEVKGTPFAGLDKVKIVSHCNQGWRTYEPYMYTEYLIYKTYNILTDLSFRVRLATIDYVNTDKEKDGEEGAFGAFFIEHVDELEERLWAKQVKDKYVLPSRYNLRALCIAEMFQFFLGNTDFSFFASEDECCHNAKVFAPVGISSGLFPVPYDFDMSGLVGTPYAKPDPHFPITSVRHRLYRGIEVDSEIWAETVHHYFEKKEEIDALWRNFEPIEEKHRTKALNYIDEFYKIFRRDEKSKVPFTAEMRNFDGMEKSIQEDIDKEKALLEKEEK